MPKANYTGGFEEGVIIREVLGMDFTPAQVFWVGNSATLQYNEKGASDGNKGTYLQPFSTIDYAVGRCKANNNDVIIVRPNHATTITAAGGITLDVAGVQIIGVGVGENRPTITFTTATAASIATSVANLRIKNFIFKCNIASQAHMIDCVGTDLIVQNCSFREGTATGLSFITADTADNDSDRLKIINCDFYAPTAGNMDNAIQLGKDFINVEIRDCKIDGDFDDAGIHVPAGGNAQVNLLIENCLVKNRLTNVAAISINGTDNSGIIRNCLLRTDTLATALDNGSLATDNVTWADETDQVSSTPVFPAVDSATNFIGVDDADNLAATTNVVANRDGSILERLEAIYAAQVDDVAGNALGINDADNVFSSSSVVANLDGSVLERLEALQDPLGGYDPLLGFRVTKTSNLADGSGTDNLFTVTGRCLITHLSGEVTTVIGGAATMKLRDVTNSVDLCAATTIDTDAVGTMYSLTSITANILNGTGATPVIGSVPNITGALPMPMAIVGDVQAPLTIAHVLDAADTGAVAWVLYYKPLTAASSIVAAA